MALVTPPKQHSPDVESNSSPEPGPGGFTAVNRHSSNESMSSGNSSPNEEPRTGSSRTTSSTYPPPNDSDHSHKRKRSGSNGKIYSPPRQYDYSPPKRAEHPQHMADKALHVLGNSDRNEITYYSSESRENWTQDRNQTNGDESSEIRLAEALQLETNTQDRSKSWDNSANGQNSNEDYEPESASNTPTQIGPKRKRNFSNRTKTGCMTCRKRKKKCDEAHPICNNCVRGGFQCQGYGVARGGGLWPKSNSTKLPVPLQSKDDGQIEISEPSIYRTRNKSPGTNKTSIHYEGGQLRPIPIDDHDQGQFIPSPPTETRTRPHYPGHQWPPQQGQPQYTTDQLPPLSELNRSDMNTTKEMSRPSSHTTAPPPPPNITHQVPPQLPPQQYWTGHQQDYRHYGPPPIEHQSHQSSHARLSSSSFDYHQKSGAKTFTVEEVEKSRMLRHSRYNHFDTTLQNERHRCERALIRYNNACKLDSGVSEEGARDILLQVLDPSKDTNHAFLAPCKEKGILSHGVKIEGPFTCTYGYNLKIMDNVYIGKNCTIDDAAKVEIGPRTWIGPNVTILTTDISKDMVDRKGTGGAWLANPVIIASEVVIGANAVIYPGSRLERGSTVEPFAVVKNHLRENQVQEAAVGMRRIL